MLRRDVCLVTGGRDFTDEDFVFATLDAVHTSTGFTVLVHGGARGLDRTADRWALDRGGVTVRRYNISPAEWERQGKSAGRNRNRQMFDENEPGVVVVFPGGRGTAHAAGIAEGIKERHPELLLVRADHVYRQPPPKPEITPPVRHGILKTTTEEGSCRCQGFYQPPDCPVHCGVLAYCDGSNSLKDGSAGLGVVLFYRDGRTVKIADACGPGSNNFAELSAIYRALKEVAPTHPLLIRTDSEWSVGALTKNWAVTKNLDLIGKIRTAMTGRQVTFEHVKGHAGEPGNEAADRLAHEGRMRDQLYAEFAKICEADARDIAEWTPEQVREGLECRRSFNLETCHPAAIDGMVLIQVLGKRFDEGEHVRLAELARTRNRSGR